MSIVGLGRSFLCAIRGIIWGVSYDRNTMIHIVAGLSAIILSLLLRIPRLDFIIILFTCFIAITMELLNNGLEKLTDVFYTDYNSKIGKIKDLMSGIVLITDIFAVTIGLLVLYKPLITALNINPVYPLAMVLLANIIIAIIIFIILISKNRQT